MAPMDRSKVKTIGFMGLGAMGFHMAGHMAKLPGFECLVWNRTSSKTVLHTAEFKSRTALNMAAFSNASVVVLCLPTSVEDEEVARRLAPHLPKGACIVSCTSGEPAATQQLAATLHKTFGVYFLDCPVSGGPRGAAAGTLTSMLGAEDAAAAEHVMPVIKSFSKKVVPCGPVGSGHAVKAVNNALNCAHLLLGAEGLMALQKFGVDPEVALSAINGSSGRSLQTEVRLPEEVLTRRFGYGFKLPLMAKDCRIASGVLKELPGATLLPSATRLVQRAAAEENDEADYTRVVCHLEREAGMELRPGVGVAVKKESQPQPKCTAAAPEAEAKDSKRRRRRVDHPSAALPLGATSEPTFVPAFR